ncbi:transglutaminase-like domain-containing protein [Tuwongella immobilis]|uniref:Transglutaminase-like domain-containing protein n=1 Tax=Tuwongella immobilis TaxID=692036 RepID=A0A6C2YYF9_9BACT|nr:transglutaminase-like domain-containing protein [Tuwongella immobilis]VIP05755.1 Transglutaminase-like enzyme, predicted cysteine protease OS=Singulisphaera acidiphila (strain ATCC BAA-1392 / DSM 18658 / VKM B-2454 / MOB10) GN=Sinac_2133 PE=4 SV=1: Transglut_core [Tuwongella immobilis]VTS08866.1 Transglutaminase-like enzyme, predicted cysteine protease OS=Singulisphaera acidiphila (strain ATCC BAA-1392 / DSM 18658 / VKM B-2454 / MOB10) GN=Sinac_2133 PE=4 SV=1: Transglut_core [Tuwongella immobi
MDRDRMPDRSRLIRRATMFLLVLASIAVEVAAADTRPWGTSVANAAGWVIAAVVASALLPLPRNLTARPPRWLALPMLALGAAPFVLEPLRRQITGDGYALELQMVFGLRNVGLALAACGGWLLCMRLACVVSLFLVLFSIAMTNHPAVLTLLGLYTAVGSVWLMLVYWSNLNAVLVPPERAVSVEVNDRPERLPWVAVGLAITLVVSVIGLVAAGPQRMANTLGEWFATSGGTGGYDPFARGGVNDGDDETSGSNPNSTGMTQTDQFLESPLPSLYDLISEQFGKPFKPKSNERAIALDPNQVKARETKKKPADNLRPNREFPTTRRSPQAPREPFSRSARAIFEIRGRTPLHIRATAYDRFDGVSWSEAPVQPRQSLLEKEESSNWMHLNERTPPEIFAINDVHEFKMTKPSGSLIPTPPHLVRFRVGRVDQANFFSWGQERVLRFAERDAPSGIIVETECRTVDPRLLPAISFPDQYLGNRFDYMELPESLAPEVRQLAQDWTAGQPRGWAQLQAIHQHLQSEYTLDAQAEVPDDCADPLRYFLLESRRGPAYQFATATAILARSLGYPTRVVTGFYAHPDHYDPETKHTPIVREDLHFWAEVLLPGGDWLILENAPGYSVLGPNLPLSERLALAFWAAVQMLQQHAVAVSVVLLTLAIVIWRRRQMIDWLAVQRWQRGQSGGWWGWRTMPTWQQRVRSAVRILERRATWAGHPRQPGQTIATWVAACSICSGKAAESALESPAAVASLRRLAQLAEWAAYAPDGAAPVSASDVQQICMTAFRDWPTTQFEHNIHSDSWMGASR